MEFKTHYTKNGTPILIPPIAFSVIAETCQRNNPPPKPPLVEVVMAGQKTQERNYSDPHYVKALADHESVMKFETTQMVLRRIALSQQFTEEKKAAVLAKRAEYADFPDDLPKNDKVCWLMCVALSDDVEVGTVINVATGQAEPTAEAIDHHVNGFHSDEARHEYLESADPPERVANT